MKYKFGGKNREECLDKASEKLKMKKDDIKYSVQKSGKGFFQKKYVIEVNTDEDMIEKNNIQKLDDIDINKSDNTKTKKEQDLSFEEVKVNDSSEEVKVNDSSLVLDTNDENEYELYFDVDIDVLVNGKKVTNGVKVTSKDKITFNVTKLPAERQMDINIAPMKVVINIKYTPEYINTIYCRKINGNLRMKKRMVEGQKPPLYKKNEILEALKAKNVVSGIKEEAINALTSKYDVKDLVIAEGLPVINDEDDSLKLLFENSKKKIDENSKETVDYRNSNYIANVCAGDKIAEIISGKDGQNGMDVFGNQISRKLKGKVLIKPGQGCKMQEACFYSLIDGQPTIKSGMIHVHKVLEKPGDIDLASGNIKFSGDVTISGSVKEGMTVESGNILQIDGNVEIATIKAQGETNIHGSIINSTITVGAKNLEKQNHIEALEELKEEISKLIEVVMDVKDRNLLGDKATDGQIVKILIETKFKTLPKKALKVLNGYGGKNYTNICNFIRNKIIGAGPLKIKFTSEINELISWLDNEINELKINIFIPSDIHISYCQDSKIESTGNVYVDGKGEYVTNITSKQDIIFTMGSSVARGGVLKANNISAKVVGSPAGVATELRVPKKGVITADVAYQNTVFYFGEMKYIMDKASRNIKASVDNEGQIVVDKLLL